MYTDRMRVEIKKICEKNYGKSLQDESGFPLGRLFTFSALLELVERIEELEEEIKCYMANNSSEI